MNNIDDKTRDGRLLLAAIAKITTESQLGKTPYEVLDQLSELASGMFEETAVTDEARVVGKLQEATDDELWKTVIEITGYCAEMLETDDWSNLRMALVALRHKNAKALDDMNALRETAEPSEARVAQGLEMLETAEKVEALRKDGIGFDISQMLIGEFDSIAPPYRWVVIIAKTQKPYSIRERLVDTRITANTQHAATLAAIAAYEAEYGEVAVATPTTRDTEAYVYDRGGCVKC